MTPSEISRLDFSVEAVEAWAPVSPRNRNWPVVYVLDDLASIKRPVSNTSAINDVYVGESRHAAMRFRQHLAAPEKQHLGSIRVVMDEKFNKSVCLDLESYLIRMLAGDGAFRVLNRNDGITEADYYDRAGYQERFVEIFEKLKEDGLFTKSVGEIENSDLFKLSPFKSLTNDQAVALEGIIEGLLSDLAGVGRSSIVVQGDPGTGKTVVAIYLMKLLADIRDSSVDEDVDSDSIFSEFFVPENRMLLAGLRIGLVVPQQSLRRSIQKVFRKTPGLGPDMVMTAFEVGESEADFDLLIVDESHRLNQRANQPSGVLNKKFIDINTTLFGADDFSKTQLDWIQQKSRHQLFMLDAAQTVRPADLPSEIVTELVTDAVSTHRHYRLATQMRVKAGVDYVGYVRNILGIVTGPASIRPLTASDLGSYEFRMFDSLAEMKQVIEAKDSEAGLSRLLAGYAWKWKTKSDPTAVDIEIDGLGLRWNSTAVDWVASANSLEEVGSIHTIQGYDLNYAGVIIGNDLRYDPVAEKLIADRGSYFDVKGKENNAALGKTYSDQDLLKYISNIYAVLMTRGIQGTYLYVCDPPLREYLRRLIPEGDVPQ